MNRAGRQDEGKAWDELVALIKTKPSLDFWKNMSLQELGSKGKRGRELRIVMPREGEDGEYEEQEAGESKEDEANPQASAPVPSSNGSNEASPRKVQATSNSFSASREEVIRFNTSTKANGSGLYRMVDMASLLNQDASLLNQECSRLLNSNPGPSISDNVIPPEFLPKMDPTIHAPSFLSFYTNSNTMDSLESKRDNFVKMEDGFVFSCHL